MSEKVSAVYPLKLIHPNGEYLVNKNNLKADVQFKLNSKKILKAHFNLTSHEDFFLNSKLEKNKSAWGLWDFDVVEVFVKPETESNTYYEFVVSPLGQFFELEIFKPRVHFNRDFVSGFSKKVSLQSNNSCQIEMQIPLENLGWKGDSSSLEVGVFSILGWEPRAYLASFLPLQEKPDFHLPQYFQKIF